MTSRRKLFKTHSFVCIFLELFALKESRLFTLLFRNFVCVGLEKYNNIMMVLILQKHLFYSTYFLICCCFLLLLTLLLCDVIRFVVNRLTWRRNSQLQLQTSCCQQLFESRHFRSLRAQALLSCRFGHHLLDCLTRLERFLLHASRLCSA